MTLGCEPQGLDPTSRRVEWQTPESKSAPLDRLRIWRDAVWGCVRRLLKGEGSEDTRSR